MSVICFPHFFLEVHILAILFFPGWPTLEEMEKYPALKEMMDEFFSNDFQDVDLYITIAERVRCVRIEERNSNKKKYFFLNAAFQVSY